MKPSTSSSCRLGLAASVLPLLGTLLVGCAGDASEQSSGDQLATSKAEWQQRPTWVNGGVPGGLDWKCATESATRVLCTAGGTDLWTTASSITGAPTYALQGATYTQVASSAASPPGRRSFSLATFASQSKVVLFGGMRRTGVFQNDLWTWDGTVWREEAPAHKPPPRQGATLVLDPTTKRMVLFGGRDEVSTFQDLWEWDGIDWTERRPVGSYPGSREAANIGMLSASIAPSGVALAVDPYTGAGWTYRDGVFTKLGALTPMRGNPAYRAGTMAYDEARKTVQQFLPNGDVYEGSFGGNGTLTWTRPPVKGRIDSVRFTTAAYDRASGNVVAFNGNIAWDLKWSAVPNQPPVVRPSQLAIQGFATEAITFSASVDDPDDRAEALSVNATNLPPGATWDVPTRTFKWTPTPAQKGTFTIQLVGSDGLVQTAPVSVKVEVLWNSYAMLPVGDIDFLTGGSYGDSFTQWTDPDRRMLRGLFKLPSIYERKGRDGYFHRESFPWPYGEPLVSCRFKGTNPGKVVASCIENNQGAQGPFGKWERPVAENGTFPRGHLTMVAGEGPAMVASGYEVYLSSTSKIVQTASATSLLRPMPAR